MEAKRNRGRLDRKWRLEHTFGLSDSVLQWIQSYSNGRSQFVRVGQQKSPSVACQGFVLGPLLCTLYVAPIAGMIASFNIYHLLCADDTHLYMAIDGTIVNANLDNCFTAVKEYNNNKRDLMCIRPL